MCVSTWMRSCRAASVVFSAQSNTRGIHGLLSEHCQLVWLQQLLAKCQREGTSWRLFHKHRGIGGFCSGELGVFLSMGIKTGIGMGFCLSSLGCWRADWESSVLLAWGGDEGRDKGSLCWAAEITADRDGALGSTFIFQGVMGGWCWGDTREGTSPTASARGFVHHRLFCSHGPLICSMDLQTRKVLRTT